MVLPAFVKSPLFSPCACALRDATTSGAFWWWIAPVHDVWWSFHLRDEPGGILVVHNTPDNKPSWRTRKNALQRGCIAGMELEKLQAHLKSRIQQHKVGNKTLVSQKVLYMQMFESSRSLWGIRQAECSFRTLHYPSLHNLSLRLLVNCFVGTYSKTEMKLWNFDIRQAKLNFNEFSPYPPRQAVFAFAADIFASHEEHTLKLLYFLCRY